MTQGTKIGLVMETVRQKIATRGLMPGDRLPSVRRTAASLHVSVSTVVEAYERLMAEGAILSRPGSGFYVASRADPVALSALAPAKERALDPFWVSRQSLEAEDGTLKPGCGWLPASWLPQTAMRRALRELARGDDATLSDYGTPLGLPALRQLIARRLSDHGIGAAPDQILLTDSGTQAIDLLCRFLLQPGDRVLIDDPCYFNFQALLRAHRVEIVGIPYTAHGPDTDRFAEAIVRHEPRLYITNSGIHNPTGARLSPVSAHRVLKLAEQHGLVIVEDDIFADFEQEPAPRLAAFDGLDRVIHIGSFSKTLSAAARCGFIAAKPDWLEGLVDLKIATSFGGGRLEGSLVHQVLRDGGYRKHLEALRLRLAHARSEVSRRLRGIGIEPWLEPEAGLFLWCRLPEGQDSAEIARKALTADIVLAPGNVFSPSQTARGFLRFNVSQSLDPRMVDVLREAMSGATDARTVDGGAARSR